MTHVCTAHQTTKGLVLRIVRSAVPGSFTVLQPFDRENLERVQEPSPWTTES